MTTAIGGSLVLLLFALSRFDAGLAIPIGHWHFSPLSLLIPLMIGSGALWNRRRNCGCGLEAQPSFPIWGYGFLAWMGLAVAVTVLRSWGTPSFPGGLACLAEIVLWTTPLWWLMVAKPSRIQIRKTWSWMTVLGVVCIGASVLLMLKSSYVVQLFGWKQIPLFDRAYLPLGVATAVVDYYLLIFPLAITLGLTATTRAGRLFWLASGLIVLLGIWLTVTRAAVALALVQVIALAGLAMLHYRITLRTIILGAVIGLLLVVVGVGLANPQTERLTSTYDNSIQWRLRGGEIALEMISDAPWFGHGVERYFRRQPVERRSRLFNDAPVQVIVYNYRYSVREPHNLYLLVTSETGLVGVLLFLSLPFGVIWLVLRRRSSLLPADRTVIIGGVVGLLAVLAHGLSESNLVARHRIALLFWIYTGLLVAFSRLDSQRSNS